MSKTYNPTYQEVLEDIEMIKLAIKLEDDSLKRDKLQEELEYSEEYLQHVLNRGTP